MDIVYPIKKGGSKSEDAELRYSLRSLERHLRVDVRDLFIFGYLPSWVRDAQHIPMEDRRDKAINLREKYRRMCSVGELSNPFLLLDDDHIFLRDTAEVPLHTNGELKDLVRKYIGTTHGRYLSAALRRLVHAKLPARNYQIHYPLLIHKETLASAVSMMRAPMVMGSIYGNLLDGPTVEVAHDFRVNTEEEFQQHSAGPFMSLPPRQRPDWLAFLTDRFQTPSRWEMA